MHKNLRRYGMIGLAASLSGCMTAAEPPPAALPIAASPVTDSRPASGEVTRPLGDAAVVRAAEILRGSGTLVGQPRTQRIASAVPSEAGITLNFVNADVAEIAKAVLGDFLKVNYAVDAAIQGTITLETSQPLARPAVLPALESAFRLSGLAIVQEAGIYRIVPLAEAARGSRVAGGSQPGFGVEIVPLRYVGAQEMLHSLEPLAPAGSLLRVDIARNLLIIAGTAPDRAAMVDNIRLFDVDWMAGMSFALFPLKAAEARAVVDQLGEVVDLKEGPLAGVLRLSAIQQMNAVLAISPQPAYLDQIAAWIERLDRAQETTERRLFVRYVQNGRATDLANVLNKVLGNASGATSAGGIGHGAAGVPDAIGAQLAAGRGGSAAPSIAAASPATEPLSETEGTKTLRITADETTNALLILGSPKEFAMVEAALDRLDIPPLQVFLEAAIAEVTLTNDLSYGLQYYFKSGKNQIIQSSGATATPAPSFPGLAYLFSSGADIQVVLSALENVTTVNVVSAPQLLVLNNQAAMMQVGDQVPIATQTSVSTVTADAPVLNTIEYRDTGVILNVTPRVNEGGLVLMDVSQEVSQVSSTTTSSLNSPTIEQRKIKSTVAVQDGETIALGGLITDQVTRGRGGIPVLQDIPYLGALFGTTTHNTTRTELLVLITPHVVQGTQKLRAVTQELQRKLPTTRRVVGKIQ